jgi:hypothetical protein
MIKHLISVNVLAYMIVKERQSEPKLQHFTHPYSIFIRLTFTYILCIACLTIKKLTLKAQIAWRGSYSFYLQG